MLARTSSPRPENTNELRWSADIPVRFADVGGMKLRYIATGTGPSAAFALARYRFAPLRFGRRTARTLPLLPPPQKN